MSVWCLRHVPSALCVALLCATSGGCGLLFPRDAGKELRHFEAQALASGELAPNLEVYDLQGNVVHLQSLFTGKPVVLQLGSYSCPVFRYRRYDMRPLRERYANRVDFVVLYTREAHPKGSASPYRDDEEWLTLFNRVTRVAVDDPASLKARLKRAADAKARQRSNARFLVDGMDNRVWSAFGSAPSAAFVFDGDGRLQARQVWVQPRKISAVLEAML